jgi:hypothetical protein
MNAELQRVLSAHADWVARRPAGERAILREAVLGGADLRGAHLQHADLKQAALSEATLRDAQLEHACLRWAVLRGADLTGADLTGADLTGADLRGADLTGANLRYCQLHNALLDGVRMSWFDPTLLAERLFRAASGDLDKQMLASYVGRHVHWCWEHLRHLPAGYRGWILETYTGWVQPGDEAPELLRRLAARGLP